MIILDCLKDYSDCCLKGKGIDPYVIFDRASLRNDVSVKDEVFGILKDRGLKKPVWLEEYHAFWGWTKPEHLLLLLSNNSYLVETFLEKPYYKAVPNSLVKENSKIISFMDAPYMLLDVTRKLRLRCSLLSDVSLARVVSPEEAYSAVYNFILSKKDKPLLEMSNTAKIKKHGFDNDSFRKRQRHETIQSFNRTCNR